VAKTTSPISEKAMKDEQEKLGVKQDMTIQGGASAIERFVSYFWKFYMSVYVGDTRIILCSLPVFIFINISQIPTNFKLNCHNFSLNFTQAGLRLPLKLRSFLSRPTCTPTAFLDCSPELAILKCSPTSKIQVQLIR
jgi:hypothetical protein